MNFPTLTRQRREGRPSLVATEAANKIIEALRRGSPIKPSCEAAGISYPTLRTWIQRGEDDKAAGRSTEFVEFLDRLTRARAEAEVNLVGKLEADPDWRAAAFILERGYRERWGKDVQQTATVQIVIDADQAAAITEALRYTSAKPLAHTPDRTDE